MAQSKVSTPAVDIWTAAAQGNLKAIKQHLDAGTDINGTFVMPGIPGSGGAPLHYAVLAGQMEATKLLVKKVANLNARAEDEHGGTPLHWAASYALLFNTRNIPKTLAKTFNLK